MTLSQVQIIQSLAEALSWFEKELSWNVQQSSLPHLTGRIGELYAAMITRGQMALEVLQKGYDVVSAEGKRVSVKTVTTSSYVHFNKNTIHHVDEVMVLRINVIEKEASIEEIFRGTVQELIDKCTDTGSRFQFAIKKPTVEPIALENLQIVGQTKIDGHRVIQYENGTIIVMTGDYQEPITMPVLRSLAERIHISPLNGAGKPMNTRQLGAAIIAANSSGDNAIPMPSSLNQSSFE